MIDNNNVNGISRTNVEDNHLPIIVSLFSDSYTSI